MRLVKIVALLSRIIMINLKITSNLKQRTLIRLKQVISIAKKVYAEKVRLYVSVIYV